MVFDKEDFKELTFIIILAILPALPILFIKLNPLKALQIMVYLIIGLYIVGLFTTIFLKHYYDYIIIRIEKKKNKLISYLHPIIAFIVGVIVYFIAVNAYLDTQNTDIFPIEFFILLSLSIFLIIWGRHILFLITESMFESKKEYANKSEKKIKRKQKFEKIFWFFFSIFCIVGFFGWCVPMVWQVMGTPEFSHSGRDHWSYYREITIKEISGKNLTNYQFLVVFVELDYRNFNFANAKEDGSDIRFSKFDSYEIFKPEIVSNIEKELDFWIEEWNQTLKTAKIWVKVPIVNEYEDTKFYMYYGNYKAKEVNQTKINKDSFNVSSEPTILIGPEEITYYKVIIDSFWEAYQYA